MRQAGYGHLDPGRGHQRGDDRCGSDQNRRTDPQAEAAIRGIMHRSVLGIKRNHGSPEELCSHHATSRVRAAQHRPAPDPVRGALCSTCLSLLRTGSVLQFASLVPRSRWFEVASATLEEVLGISGGGKSHCSQHYVYTPARKRLSYRAWERALQRFAWRSAKKPLKLKTPETEASGVSILITR